MSLKCKALAPRYAQIDLSAILEKSARADARLNTAGGADDSAIAANLTAAWLGNYITFSTTSAPPRLQANKPWRSKS